MKMQPPRARPSATHATTIAIDAILLRLILNASRCRLLVFLPDPAYERERSAAGRDKAVGIC
jgi:hypothetical protein